ncbi:MAG: ribose 5-phosphate isomerase B [Actinomycetota bacterium]
MRAVGDIGAVPSEDEVRALVSEVVSAVTGERQERGPSASHAPDLADGRGAGGGGGGPGEDVAIGADHGGFHLKERIAADLLEHGFTVRDCGTGSTEPVDYPDFAYAVARLVAGGRCRWGIVVDGAGIGSAITANKVPGIRAATCWDISSARNSREHNHANVLTLGAGLLGESLALQVVQAWLSTGWGGGRHDRRVEKITEIERGYRQDAPVRASS